MTPRSSLRSFIKDERGAALAEAALAAPIMFFLFAFVFVFGSLFYNAQIAETAARDAARYLARTDVPAANETAARNLAVYSNIAGTGGPRIVGLTVDDVAISYASEANPVDPATGERAYRGPDPISIVRVQVTWTSIAAGLWSLFGIGPVDYVAVHEQRVIGD